LVGSNISLKREEKQRGKEKEDRRGKTIVKNLSKRIKRKDKKNVSVFGQTL
jgi:hypothetical protein